MSKRNSESLWWHVLSNPKMLLMVVAGPAVVYLGARNLETTLFERSPATIRADRFAADYHGQRWLHVEGRLLPEYANVQASNNGFVNVDVPLVPLDWKKGETVHIVRSFSIQGSELAAWKDKTSRSPKYSLTGLQGPLGPMRYWDMFPMLKWEEPVVYINDGHTPDSSGMGIFLLAICGFFLIASWTWLLRLIAVWWSQLPQGSRFDVLGRQADTIPLSPHPVLAHFAAEAAVAEATPDDLDHFSLAVFALGAGRVAEALEELSIAIEENPEDVEAYQQRTMAYLGLDCVEEALTDAQKAAVLAPEDVESYFVRGKALMRNGLYDLAMADFDVVIDDNDDHASGGNRLAEAYYQRGLARAIQKDMAAAIRDLSRAIFQAPNRAEVYEARAAAYDFLGKTKKAQRDREEAGYRKSKPPQ
jgi:Tfp pilus assembly protein PilF